MRSRNYRDGWNAALAGSRAGEGARRTELGESQITYGQRQQRVVRQYAADRSPTKELIEPLTGDTKVIDTNTGRIIETRRAPAATEGAQEAALEWLKDKPIVGMLDEVVALIAAARVLATQSMRDAVLRWHDEQRVKYRDLSGTNGIAGAHMTAHEESIAAIRALDVDKGEQ